MESGRHGKCRNRSKAWGLGEELNLGTKSLDLSGSLFYYWASISWLSCSRQNIRKPKEEMISGQGKSG
jgi:hypothetical protein